MLFFRLLLIIIYTNKKNKKNKKKIVGLPSSINDSCGLRKLALYNKAQCHNLFSPNKGVESSTICDYCNTDRNVSVDEILFLLKIVESATPDLNAMEWATPLPSMLGGA